jgi:uncharacterized protein
MSLHPAHAIPIQAGAGFKPEHLDAILRDGAPIDFFEVHAENYMGEGGAPHAALSRLRRDYPLFLHGVGLSIGGDGPLDLTHLARFKVVADRYEPLVVSEHLAWSSHDGTYFNDLLPVPYTRDRLNSVVEHIHQVQDVLGRKMLLENPSTYIQFEFCDMDEISFIREVATRTGCGLLLDVNNVFVSSTNHGYSATRYLAEFPLNLVEEIHLAGHATEEDDAGAPLLIDSHDRAVCEEVWALFDSIIARTGAIATLIEWDNDVPDWSILKAEASAANRILQRHSHSSLRHAV